MTLTYAKYIELMTALDEYTGCRKQKNTLQNFIFQHYMQKYGYFVAENINGVKLAIWDSFNKKVFRKHMNSKKQDKHGHTANSRHRSKY